MIYAIVENDFIVNFVESEEALAPNWFPLQEKGRIGDTFINGHVVSQEVAHVNKVALLDFVVKSNNEVKVKKGNIFKLPVDNSLLITATVNDKDSALSDLLVALNVTETDLTVMAERVVNGDLLDVKGDIRFDMLINENGLSIASARGFDRSGNYVVTQERLNKGLKAVGIPFEIEMDLLEFDVINT